MIAPQSAPPAEIDLKHAHPINTQPDPGDPVLAANLRGAISVLLRRKWLIMICGLVAGALALGAAVQIERAYKATATIMLEVQEPEKLITDAVERQVKFGKDRLKNEVSVLQSSDLAARVVARLRLDADPVFANTAPDQHPFWDVVDVVRPPKTTAQADPVARVQKNLILEPVDGSRVIRISYLSGDPALSARVSNGFAEQYIEDQLTAKLEARTVANTWLMGRVDELRLRLEASENEIAEEQAKLSHHGGQGLRLTEQQMATLNDALTKSRRDTLRLQGLFDRLSEAVADKTDLSEISEFRNSLTLRKLRFEEGKLLTKRAEAIQTRDINRLDLQLGDVRAQMGIEAARIVAAVGVDLEASKEQDRALTQDLRRLETKSLDQAQQNLRITQLKREAEANSVLYKTFLGRLQELSKQDGLETADARLVSRAIPPLAPLARRQPVIIAAGIVSGLMIGAVLALLLERLNTTIRGTRALEMETGLPVLATIPTIGTKIQRKDVVRSLKENPNSALAEAIRNLRTSVLFANPAAPPKVIMFTSTAPAEGKSTTAMLLAMTARSMGKSVIIVDCDLRRPTLNSLIASPNQGAGLLSVLSGIVPVEEAVVQDMDTGLHALMMRPEEASPDLNAADILASPQFRATIAQLRVAYDLVILDTPPSLAVTDARIVSANADAVIYAVRWNETPQGAIQEGLREMQSVGAPVTGLILTMIDDARAAKYADDNFGSYRGRYGGAYLAQG